MNPAVVAGLLAIFWMSAAHACSPPDIGDQFHFKNGPLLEVVKVTSPACNIKLCGRPVGSKQPCRWVKDPRTANPDLGETWIIMNGVDQTTTPECDPSVGFTVGCRQ
jgi:hypothetical protein